MSVYCAGLLFFQTRALCAEPVLIVDLDRLRFETLYGQKINQELYALRTELDSEETRLNNEFEQEEARLTEQRDTLAREDFREMAEEFDAKAMTIRREQIAKRRALVQRARDLDGIFIEKIRPILSELMAEKGATAMVEDGTVFLSVPSADITAEAIVKINIILGDGSQ